MTKPAAALVFVVALVCGAAIGETAPTNSIVVYASRICDRAEAMAAPVEIIDAEAIARSGARDVSELLEKRANVQIRTMNSNPLQAQVAMRGFGENSFGRVKVIVDGEELNGVDMDAPNLARIPLGNIERVEVIRGPSSVLYGDGAVAGVINITTDTHDYARKTRLTASGGAYGTFGANVQTKGGFEEEGVLYSGSYDYRRTDGYRDRSGYDLHTFNGALRKNFANGSTVGFKANYFNALYEMPGALSYGELRQDERKAKYGNDWCRLWNYGFSLDSRLAIADDQWLCIDGAFTYRHRRSNWGDYGYANEYDLYGYQFSPRYVNERELFGFDNKFTFGFDFKYDLYQVTDRSGYNNPRYEFDRDRYGLFAQDEFFFIDELSLVVGARLERINNRWHDYEGLVEPNSHNVMGDYEVGLVYRPVDDLKTYIKASQFHRSAFCDELNYTEDGRMLQPEKGASLDAGLEFAFLEEFRFDLSGYWMVMKDEIFYNPYAKSLGAGYWGGYNCNSPDYTRRLGFDTGLGWLRDKVAEASVKYAFVDSRFIDGDYEDEQVPLVPESRVRAEAGVWLMDDLELKGGYRFVSNQVLAGDFANEHGRLDGYSLFDLGLYYSPYWAEGWKASFVVDNLLGESYCDFAGWSDYTGAYYYPGCGRSFMLTVSYEF